VSSGTGSYDVVIVGGGVVGCHCARELSRYDLRVLLLEKESDVCSGASKANSAIVHACLSPSPGSFKARLCLEGNRLMPQVCADLGVAFERNGALTVALHERELRVLRALQTRGERNGERDLRILSGSELQTFEPALAPSVRAALLSPSAGIVDPFMLTIAAAENAVANGVEVRLETRATGVVVEGERVAGVLTDRGDFRCRFLVNAAGLYADEVMRYAGIDSLQIRPRRGDYFVLDKMDLVRHTIFPVPTPVSKGILIVPTTHGNVLLGPTSLPDCRSDLPPASAAGLAAVREQVLRLVPGADTSRCIAVFAGVRPSGARDFVIGMARRPRGLLNLAGIESPGLTASPAIARLAVSLLAEAGLSARPRPGFDPIRRPPPRPRELCWEERAALIERDSRYGRIVCRCEGVSEGEIVAATRGPLPARTLDAVKKRTRAMTGRCQAGFDMPLILEIMARELGVEPWQVTKYGPGSEVLAGPSVACLREEAEA